MRHAAVASSPFTASMLDTLLTRWQEAPWLPTVAPQIPADPMASALELIAQTVGPFEDRLGPHDRCVYASLMALSDSDELRDAFFTCFDLMVRTRGPAIAMVRLRELHRLLG